MNILLYINANKALVSINHNLLPQIKICYRRDDLAAATVLPHSLGKVIAVQVIVIVQLVQDMDALAGHAAVLRFCSDKQQGSLTLCMT